MIVGDRVRVFLTDVCVDVKCGLHPWERYPEHPNRLLVNVEVTAAWPLRHAHPDGSRFIDYDRMRNHILGWRDRPHTDLLETLLEDLVAEVFEDPNVEACRVSIAKPDIFNETGRAGVELSRQRPAV